MQTVFPAKLKKGDGVRVVAPARSLAMPWLDNAEMQEIANERFAELGLKLSFGKHIRDIDEFDSTTIQNRINDLHDAFADKDIQMIITVIGGFNSNQLLQHLDYTLIQNNPKIVCGYSDITALLNAIYAKTGLTTYYGPHYFSFGEKHGFEYSLEYVKKCLMSDEPFEVVPSKTWSNDLWCGNQEERSYIENDGWWVLNDGQAKGHIVGGNQCTLNLLQGTEYMPEIQDSVLFLEDDEGTDAATVDRDLQSLIHQPGFKEVQGIVFGRFQPNSNISNSLLEKIVSGKNELSRIPVIANVDFGHTNPRITFPIGGTVRISAAKQGSITIQQH